MRQIFLFFLYLLFCNSKIHAQNFTSGIGPNVSVVFTEIDNSGAEYTFHMNLINVSWFPRYTLNESKNSSFSVGSPLCAGIATLNNLIGGSGTGFGLEVPVVLDYNIGSLSSIKNDKEFGFYLGAGFSYLFAGWRDNSGFESLSSYGPLGRIGIRINNGKKWITTIGTSFKYGLESGKYKTIGFSVLWNRNSGSTK